MTVENQETDSSMSQDANLKVDDSRRSFAKKSVTIAPVLMTLANKTALGATPYHCTVSGQQSGNQSGAHDTTTPCNVGDSPSTWASANQSRWIAAGATIYRAVLATEVTKIICAPLPGQNNRVLKTTTLSIKFPDENGVTQTIQISSNSETKRSNQCTASEIESNTQKKYYFDGSKYTKDSTIYNQILSKKYYFKDVFGGNSTESLLKILQDSPSSVDAYAVASWLNAGVKSDFSPVYDDINQAYIVSAYASGHYSFFNLITK